MATVIDSLIVELGLDPAKFTKGQKDAAEAFAKTKEEATKSGKGIEEASEKAAQSLAKLARQALELYAIFLGGRGITQFIADITASDSALGRFSNSLNESPQTIAAWGLAVERAGGSSAATSASFQSLSDKIEDLRLRGKALPDVFYQLQAAGGRTIELNRGVGQSMIDIAANLKAVAGKDQATASWLGRQLGIDADTVNMMIKHGAGIGAEIERLKKLGPSAKDIAAAQELQKAWSELTQEAEHFGRALWTSLSPALIHAMDRFDAWMAKKENQEKFNALIKQLSDWIDGIDWDKTVKGVEDFVAEADKGAKAIGGWMTAGETLFALWMGSKFLAVLANARALAAAMGAGGLGTLGLATLALYETVKPQPTNETETEIQRQKRLGQFKNTGLPQGEAPSPRQKAAPEHIALHDKNASSPVAAIAGKVWGAFGKLFGSKPQKPQEPQTIRNGGGDAPSSGGTWDAISGAFGKLFGVTGAKAEGVQMEGRPVDRGNPLAVMVTNAGGGQLYGQGINGSSGPGSGGGSTGRGSSGGGSSGPGNAGVGGWWTADRQKQAAEYLMKNAGLSKHGAAGLVARWAGVEAAGGPTSVNPRSGAVGIAQGLGSRKAGYLGSFEQQLANAARELNTTEKKAGDALRAAGSPDEGARGASMFERAEGYNGATGRDNFTGRTPAQKVYSTVFGGDKAAVSTPRVTPSPSVTNSTNTRTRATTSTSTNETHIGSITVQTQATDAAGIAKELPRAMERSSFASQANAGPE